MSAKLALAVLATLALAVGAGCSRQSAHEPKSVPRYQTIEVGLAQLENAVNHRAADSICAQYQYPSSHCKRVWRQRLVRLNIPVDLRVREVVFGCAGDVRATLRTSDRPHTIGTVSMTTDMPDRIIDVGIGDRKSSLVIPRYGDCADAEGDAGDERCDAADEFGSKDATATWCTRKE
jgi:hypothetical protein